MVRNSMRALDVDPMTEKILGIRLKGGPPWGFRLKGGKGAEAPLHVSTVSQLFFFSLALSQGKQMSRLRNILSRVLWC